MQNEFEKKVQDRLKEFALTPGDAVWGKVAARIATEKKRKRLAYFWWTAGIVLLMGGAAFWLTTIGPEKNQFTTTTPATTGYKNNETNAAAPVRTETPRQVSKQPTEMPASTTNNAPSLKEDIATPGAINTRAATQNKQTAATGIQQQLPITHQRSISTPGSSQKVPLPGERSIVQSKQQPASDPGKQTIEQSTRKQVQTPMPGDEPIAGNSVADRTTSINQEGSDRTASAVIANAPGRQTPVDQQAISSNNSSRADNTHIDEEPKSRADLPTSFPTPATTVKDSAMPLLPMPLSKKAVATNRIEVGVSMYIGWSDNKTGFPLLSEKSLADYSGTAPQNSTGGSGNQTRVDMASPLSYRSALSYGVGGFASMSLAKRIRLSGGLEYQYYSAKTFAGTRVNSQRTLFDSVFNVGVVVPEYYNSAALNTSFGSVYDFTNTYHFLQVPVTMQYRINNASKRPLYLLGGVTPGVLMGSHALYYNRFAGISYVDKKQFLSFQLSLDAGLQKTMLNSRNYSVSFGPHIRYGATNINRTVLNTPQHLFFFGLKTNVVFNRP